MFKLSQVANCALAVAPAAVTIDLTSTILLKTVSRVSSSLWVSDLLRRSIQFI